MILSKKPNKIAALGCFEQSKGVKIVEYDKIVIAPCLPSAWDKVNYKRSYNGSVYDITVYNNSGKSYMTVDGETVEGNSVPKFEDERTHIIEVFA